MGARNPRSSNWRALLPPLPHLWAPIEPGLDPGIEREATTLYHHGIETYESCQGGMGHCYPEPTVRFHGESGAGYRALAIALEHGFRVTALRRGWVVRDGLLVEAHWELVFQESTLFAGRKTLRGDGFYR